MTCYSTLGLQIIMNIFGQNPRFVPKAILLLYQDSVLRLPFAWLAKTARCKDRGRFDHQNFEMGYA